MSSVLASFVCHHNVRGFVFDVTEVLDFPASSFEAILERAGGGAGWWRNAPPPPVGVCLRPPIRRVCLSTHDHQA